MMIRTGDGGDSAPVLTSNVSVDPGEIQSYARFLSEMSSDLKELRAAVGRLERLDENVFGAYDPSARAAQRSRDIAVTEGKFLDTLSARLAKIVDHTYGIARDYIDLDELNSASGTAINQYLSSDQTDD